MNILKSDVIVCSVNHEVLVRAPQNANNNMFLLNKHSKPIQIKKKEDNFISEKLLKKAIKRIVKGIIPLSGVITKTSMSIVRNKYRDKISIKIFTNLTKLPKNKQTKYHITGVIGCNEIITINFHKERIYSINKIIGLCTLSLIISGLILYVR